MLNIGPSGNSIVSTAYKLVVIVTIYTDLVKFARFKLR